MHTMMARITPQDIQATCISLLGPLHLQLQVGKSLESPCDSHSP